jgi:peptidoglycan/LPS O-acetylase OafA/YrhL
MFQGKIASGATLARTDSVEQRGPLRLDRLDHLRFIAALLVLIWHFPAPVVPDMPNGPALQAFSILAQGHTGVAFFCVISGFIFTHLYMGKDIIFKNFLFNRIVRLGPMLVLMVLLTFYTGAWNPVEILAAFLTTLNKWWFPGYIAPGWTILIEMQFYLVFPLLILFCRRYGPAYLVALIGLLFVLRFLVWFDKGTVQELAYTSIIGRGDQFLLGMVVALVLPSVMVSAPRRHLTLICGAVAAAALIAFFAYFHLNGGYFAFGGSYPTPSPVWIWLPTIEALGYAGILAAYLVVPGLKFAAASYAGQAFAFLGRISYSMYLLHLLVFRFCFGTLQSVGFVASSWEQRVLLLLVFGLPCVVALSAATYFLIEKPFLSIKRPATR